MRVVPEAFPLNPAVFGLALAALLYGVLAFSAARAVTGTRSFVGPQRVFAAAVAASAVWGLTGVALHALPSLATAAAHAAADLARYALWFWLLLALIPAPSGPANRAARGRLRMAAAIVLFAGAVALLAGFVSLGDSIARWRLFGLLSLPVCGLVLLEQLFRNVPDDLRWHAKPLSLAVACVFLYDIYLYSLALLTGSFDSASVAVRGTVHALAVPLLFVASKRHGPWVAQLQVSRSAAFHTATLLLTGLYLLFIAGVGYYVRDFGGEWGTALQLGLVCVALVVLAVLVFSGAARARVRVFIGKNFFSYRYDYRTEWLRFTAMLSGNSSPREMGGLVVRGLAEMLPSPAGALWSVAPGGSEIVQSATWNFPSLADSEPAASRFAGFLLAKEWIVDLDEYRRHPERYDGVTVPPWLLESKQAWLVVPLIMLGQLIGFVVLARPHVPTELNWEVRDLLKTASRQAASYLAQMNAAEALLETRKFDAFNKMSAFVVHDLKNIVTQLSLMMQNARRLQDNPEFRQDMLTTVENSLEKMRQLILQLREGETPVGVLHRVDLAPVAQRLQALSLARGRSLELQMDEGIVVPAHEERIARVLGHLVQNAFDATPAPGRVWLSIERDGSVVKAIVGDTGHGMTAEFVQTRLFKPFHTTKQSGMGIGAYESDQYVRELGGRIVVDTEAGRGTVITLHLPLFESRQAAELETTTAK